MANVSYVKFFFNFITDQGEIWRTLFYSSLTPRWCYMESQLTSSFLSTKQTCLHCLGSWAYINCTALGRECTFLGTLTEAVGL